MPPRTPAVVLSCLVLLGPLTACSFKGAALKDPSASSSSSGSHRSSPSTPTANTPNKVDTVAFCDGSAVHQGGCTAGVTSYSGSQLGCAARLRPGSKVTITSTRNGVPLRSDTRTMDKPGPDGTVLTDSVLQLDPAQLPKGTYGCEFTVDARPAVKGSVNVKGPSDTSGVAEVRYCQHPAKPDSSTSTMSCSDDSDQVDVQIHQNSQCSAVLVGMKGQAIDVIIHRGTKEFPFHFTAQQIDKNLGVITAGMDLTNTSPLECEIRKNGKKVTSRIFQVTVHS